MVATRRASYAPDNAPATSDASTRGGSRGVKREKSVQLLQLLFHIVAAAAFFRVWIWHFTPAAAVLPGSRGFGRFFRYMTFCGLSLQTLAVWPVCIAADLQAVVGKRKGKKSKLLQASDIIACAVFPLACVVTAMYYAISAGGKGLVEEGNSKRPAWLSPAVHVGNSVPALVDVLLCSPRSFSRQSQTLSYTVSLAYMAWLLLVRHQFGEFPYPFLNKLPQPWTFLATASTGLLFFRAFFVTGRWLRQALHRTPPKQTRRTA